jgi:hypothetical protein
MKNRIFAMPAAAPAILVKPSTAAMIATMKNVKAQDNMTTSCKSTVRLLNAYESVELRHDNAVNCSEVPPGTVAQTTQDAIRQRPELNKGVHVSPTRLE